MSKAILVVDMPSSCSKCQLIDCYNNCPATGLCLEREMGTEQFEKKIYDKCPLKPMPEKITSWKGKSTNYQQGHRDGYNACIDELLK